MSGISGLGVPDYVGVLGGGRMGAGIAHAFALAGANVQVVERDAESVTRARSTVLAALLVSIKKETTEFGLDELTARIGFSTDFGTFANAGLVVEAVPESLEIKLPALARIEESVGPEAWIASNTSSISISRLAEQLKRPDRFCGLHFFNPVPSSKLVEIVVGEQTASELTRAAGGWVNALGKTPITVRDVPGFASSRLGVAIALEAMRMLEDGVATAEDIDAAMVLGYGHPMGPLKLTDLVGLDVRLGIAEYLEATLGDRFSPPKLLRDKVARGELGRKSGRGFYDWPKEDQA
ncbi:MAG: 3-hydroxyacyl-CoA dehydrogenase family protein [Cryobacterium sp.]|nr:3-hydroxyacyl-CoA dehydrogenase family protein [Cryobacterium sp.]MCW5944507.1 3-hydroxyacyl-CoA dehydrogenase family protein [Cryobacterium sp.]